MIHYAKFLSKRILCRKSNIYLILASIAIVCVFLVMNMRSQDTLRENIESQLQATHHEGYFNRGVYEKLLSYYDNKDWPMVYSEYSKILEENREASENAIQLTNDTTNISNESLSYFNRELAYIQYLNNHNLVYENAEFPIFGLTFTTSISQIILPIMITSICIYILSQLFTIEYSKHIDMSMLLPIGKRKVFLTKMILGITISILVFSIILLSSFILASLFTFHIGLEYPIMVQDISTGSWLAIKAVTLFKDWFFIGSLFLVNVCLFTCILSFFIKEEGPLFLVTICIILGLALLPMVTGYCTTIAHILPTTYMNYVDVVIGTFTIRYGNVNVSTSTGFQVLSIVFAVQLVLCIAKNYIKQK